VLSYLGAKKYKHIQTHKTDNNLNGKLMVLGAVLDGIPESAALGVALFAGGGTGMLMLVAIFLSNFPESISSIPGLKNEGFSNKRIILSWFWDFYCLFCISDPELFISK